MRLVGNDTLMWPHQDRRTQGIRRVSIQPLPTDGTARTPG